MMLDSRLASAKNDYVIHLASPRVYPVVPGQGHWVCRVAPRRVRRRPLSANVGSCGISDRSADDRFLADSGHRATNATRRSVPHNAVLEPRMGLAVRLRSVGSKRSLDRVAWELCSGARQT